MQWRWDRHTQVGFGVGGLGFRARGFVVSGLGCSGGGIEIHKSCVMKGCEQIHGDWYT